MSTYSIVIYPICTPRPFILTQLLITRPIFSVLLHPEISQMGIINFHVYYNLFLLINPSDTIPVKVTQSLRQSLQCRDKRELQPSHSFLKANPILDDNPTFHELTSGMPQSVIIEPYGVAYFRFNVTTVDNTSAVIVRFYPRTLSETA